MVVTSTPCKYDDTLSRWLESWADGISSTVNNAWDHPFVARWSNLTTSPIEHHPSMVTQYDVNKKLPKIIASKVSVPDPGKDPMAFLHFLPDRFHRWVDAEELFCEKVLNPPPVFHNIDDVEYFQLIRIIKSRVMLVFSDVPPLFVNGMFGVPKGVDLLRLIYDPLGM